MSQNRKDTPPEPFTPDAPAAEGRRALLDGHLPEILEPLVPLHPDNAFTATRRLRHDGWTPEKKRLFLERFAECGVVLDACETVGMSARAAYNLRDRDPLFAAGWEAACAMARPRLADEAFARSMNGVVERIYKDGVIVAERHRYDNRLTMAVLTRLDARMDRAEERGSPHLALVRRWDDYLDALSEDRQDDGMALLAPPAPGPVPSGVEETDLQKKAGHHELRELDTGDDAEPTKDRHEVWVQDEVWWTNYPPPDDFDGEEQEEYGSLDYQRTLTSAERAILEANEAAMDAIELAEAEAQRDAYFEDIRSCVEWAYSNEIADEPAGGG